MEPTHFKHRNIVFWSDIHDEHDRDFIYAPRNFTNVEAAKNELRSRLYKKVNGETLFLLGDTCFGKNAEQNFLSILNTVNSPEIYVMPGNHFSGYKQVKKSHGAHFELSGKRIHLIPNYYEITVCGQPIVLSHYPVVSWNGNGRGSWMIHGHCHGNLYKSDIGKLLYTGKIKDIGVEVCPHPVSFDELKAEFDSKNTVSFDHHGKNTQNPF